MVFLSSRISPFTSTVIFFDKSPRATAVVTSAMLRTWPVRLVAIALTLSVRSFQVPATPLTRAWPPSLPSVPTSRATRVTSEAKPVELVDHRVDDLADAQEFAAQRAAVDLDGHALGQVALGDGADHARHLGSRLDHVFDQLVDRANGGFPAATGVLEPPALADLAFLADDLGKTLELLRHFLVERDHLVEETGDFAVDAVHLFGQTNGKVATAQGAESADELTAINEVARGLDIHSTLRVALFPHPG